MLICLDLRTRNGCGAKSPNGTKFCPKCGNNLRFALELHDPNDLIGRYRVRALIGYGGFGAVYAVEAQQQLYALKETFDPASIRSFQTEFAVLQGLTHDNLPHYHEWFEADGNGYLVMELVAGTNLEEILKRQGGPLPQSQVLGYAVQLCDVLSYLHIQAPPIFHRDIKPANIRFTPEGLLKLVDFGLLKQGTQMTHTALRGLGTEEYTPLEQYGGAGRHTDQRSDLYSLGATLYHLLTGQTPPVVTTRIATSTDPLQPADHLNKTLAPHVAAALHQALQPIQDARYPNVASFKAALLHAPVAGSTSAGAPTTVLPAPVVPTTVLPAPDPAALRRLWQQAHTAYVLGRWEQAEALLAQVAALNPQYEDVQTLWAEARRQTERERHYAEVTALRASGAWEQVLTALAKLPPDFPDPQGHRPWAAVHQRREQRYGAALVAAKSQAWRTMIDHLTALLAETPGDVDATALLAHAQAMQAEVERPQREAAARRQREEARQRLIPAMVEVPAGPFLMGSSNRDKAAESNEKPQHTLTLPRYWIGKTLVTNAQFRPFVDSDGYTNQAYWTTVGWQWRVQLKLVKPGYWDDAQFNGADYPVIGVSWFEALAYCRWLSKQVGIEFRLPSEAEWEKAARGPDGRIYPWGNTWENGRCNSEESGLKRTTPVGQYPTGASPYGALDMAGNVWEWCATTWGKPYPYQLEDEWQAAYVEADQNRVLRGGSAWHNSTYVRGAYRSSSSPRDSRSLGLRVASHSLVPGSGS